MLDRYEQHTLNCSSCKKAHEVFEILQKIFIGSTVLFAAGVGIPPEVNIRVILAVCAVISAALVYLLKEMDKNFVFIDYVHANID